jgi:hypothetical protein
MVARGLGNRSHEATGETITERLFLAGIGQDSHWRTAEREEYRVSKLVGDSKLPATDSGGTIGGVW